MLACWDHTSVCPRPLKTEAVFLRSSQDTSIGRQERLGCLSGIGRSAAIYMLVDRQGLLVVDLEALDHVVLR